MAKVAVLLSTYNGQRFLQEQLDSLFAQKNVGLTVFVRDDGSKDQTVAILRENVLRHNNLRLSEGENVGVIASFLTLIEQAGDGFDYYALCDQDDVWKVSKLITAIRFLQEKESNQPLLYCSALEYVDSQLDYVGRSKTYLSPSFGNALVENIVTGCTTVFNQQLRRLMIEHRPRRAVMHDWWLYLLATAFGEVVFDPKSYIKYRQHGSNVIGATPRFFPLWRRRLSIVWRRETIVSSIQVVEFYNYFGAKLAKEKRVLIEHFLKRKDSPYSRWWLLCSTRLIKQTMFETVAIKTLILLGWY